ncbi:MAG: shikimate dehydrogenase family protein [Candidatus Zixiibacteriota bacterium]
MKNKFKFGLVGFNISYSRSADIFKAIFKIKNIDGAYELYDIPPDSFDSRFPELLEDNLNGLSVTIPYKNKVIPYLFEIDPIADALGAVNSVLVKDKKFLGYNTDSYGFSLPLKEYSLMLKRGNALIFGAGGAAKAAIYSLYLDYEVDTFFIMGRNLEKLKTFKNSLNKQIDNIKINILSIEDYQSICKERYEIIVNCTPLGGWNHAGETSLPKNFNWLNGKIYYDLNYNDNNRIITEAKEKSQIVIDGSTMLVGQALRSFYLWTGITIAFDPVYHMVFNR